MKAEDRKLTGRIAAIAGVRSEVGRALALKLASHGAQIMVCDQNGEAAQAVTDVLQKRFGVGRAFVGKLTQPGVAEQFIRAILDQYSELHILAAAIAESPEAKFESITDADWAQNLDQYLRLPFHLWRAAGVYFRETGGQARGAGVQTRRKVVSAIYLPEISHMAGRIQSAAAGEGVRGMTKSLAKEWGRYNVTVNCVTFGSSHAELSAGSDRSDDVANAGYLFCIPESDYVTGEILRVGPVSASAGNRS